MAVIDRRSRGVFRRLLQSDQNTLATQRIRKEKRGKGFLTTSQHSPENKFLAKKFVITAASLLFALLAAAWLFPRLDWSVRVAISYGGLISAFLSFTGFFLLYNSRAASVRKFIKLVLGGMLIRLLLALSAIALGIGVFALPAPVLVGSCVISYVIFTVIEHAYLFPVLTRKKST